MKNRSMQLKTINKLLAVILIILVATLFRIYPIYQFSFQPSGYNGQIEIRSLNIEETGHSSFSSRGEILIDIYTAEQKIIINQDPQIIFLITTLTQCICFSLVIILFTKPILKDKTLDLIPMAFIVLFSIFATPDVITRLSGWNGPYLWIFYFLAFYLIIFKKQTKSIICLSMLLLIILPIAYFTEAIFVFLLLIILLIYQLVYKRTVIPNTHIILYIMFFIIYEIYISDYSMDWIFQIITMITTYTQNTTRSQLLNYIAGGTNISMIKNLICIVLASIPLIYFIIIGKKKFDTKIVDLFNVLLLTIFVFGIIIYFWMGFTGIAQRIPLYGALLSILAFTVLSAKKTNNKNYMILIFFISVAIIFSGYTYITSDYNSSAISFDEEAASNWLITHTYKSETIFTDLRLSGPLTYNGYSPVILNDVFISPETVNKLLEEMFYKIDSPVDAFYQLDKLNNVNIRLIYFSTSFTERFPGIKGFDYSFLPASKDYLERYDELNQFDVIYRNHESTILYIKDE
jgi:hypothetical protein